MQLLIFSKVHLLKQGDRNGTLFSNELLKLFARKQTCRIAVDFNIFTKRMSVYIQYWLPKYSSKLLKLYLNYIQIIFEKFEIQIIFEIIFKLHFKCICVQKRAI